MEGERSSNNDMVYVPDSDIVIQEQNENTDILSHDSDPNLTQSFRPNSNVYVSMASIIRVMRSILPDHARIADDAKETVQICVSQFISHVTNMAKHKCQNEYRKMICADDIISGMGTLGFDNYVEPLSIYLERYRAQYPERNRHQIEGYVGREEGSSSGMVFDPFKSIK